MSPSAEKDAARREVIHDPDCGVPTGRTWACACNERNGYRDA